MITSFYCFFCRLFIYIYIYINELHLYFSCFFCLQQPQPHDLLITAHIINKIEHSCCACRPRQSDSADIQFVHDTFHEAKHMFHAATRLGFHPVALLLLFRQRMASVAPFAYSVLHPIFFQRFLQTYIRAVRIQLLPLVILSEQVIQVASCSKSQRTSGTAPRMPRSSPISHGTAISSSRQTPCPPLTGRESGGTTAQRVAYL